MFTEKTHGEARGYNQSQTSPGLESAIFYTIKHVRIVKILVKTNLQGPSPDPSTVLAQVLSTCPAKSRKSEIGYEIG
jgi:hypothetical protein